MGELLDKRTPPLTIAVLGCFLITRSAGLAQTLTVMQPTTSAVSPPLSQIPNGNDTRGNTAHAHHPVPSHVGAGGSQPDTAVQTSAGPLINAAGETNFDGAGVNAWNGLRFGMTATEVKAILETRAVKAAEDLLVGKSDSYVGLIVKDLKIGDYNGVADLKFDRATHHLNSILIVATGDEQHNAIERLVDAERLYSEYLKKYGRPVSIRGCAVERRFPCGALWRDKYQSIDLHIIYSGARINVEYKAATGGRKDN